MVQCNISICVSIIFLFVVLTKVSFVEGASPVLSANIPLPPFLNKNEAKKKLNCPPTTPLKVNANLELECYYQGTSLKGLLFWYNTHVLNMELVKCDSDVKQYIKVEKRNELKVQMNKCIVYKRYETRSPETKSCSLTLGQPSSGKSPVTSVTVRNALRTTNEAIKEIIPEIDGTNYKVLTYSRIKYKELNAIYNIVDLSYYLHCYESIGYGLLYYQNEFVLLMTLDTCGDSVWNYVMPKKEDGRHEITVRRKDGCNIYNVYFEGLKADRICS
ncbi:uncharacterized protein LOC128997183 [Macrosteles quadrilineatus]|uniref:uncharacterized protein LOC128997183 n=1 Tax=Macrosteles quadrilineatus TaxID=74068 RepID=UPI0023E10FE7|nr:uncharacterized protein LOC128997183 [Macrosteles quadrilineatus]